MMTYDRVVGTSKNYGFNIRIKLQEIILDKLFYCRCIVFPLFDKRYKIWGSNFLNDDRFIKQMYSIFIGSYIDGGLCGENPYFFISRFKYLFGPRNRDAKNFSIRKTNLLKISDSVCCSSIAGKYNNSRSLVKKELNSLFRILPN